MCRVLVGLTFAWNSGRSPPDARIYTSDPQIESTVKKRLSFDNDFETVAAGYFVIVAGRHELIG